MKPEKRRLLRDMSQLLGGDFRITGSKHLRRSGPICFGLELETLPYSEDLYRPTLIACSLLDDKPEFYLRRYFDGARVGFLELSGNAELTDIESAVGTIKSQCFAVRNDCPVSDDFVIRLYRDFLRYSILRREMVFLPWISLINFQRFCGFVDEAKGEICRLAEYVDSLPKNLRQIYMDHYKSIVDREIVVGIEELRKRFDIRKKMKPWVSI